MKTEAIFMATQPLVIIIPLVSMTIMFNHPVPFGLFFFCLMILSVILLFFARLPLYKKGEFFKIGPGAIDKKRLKCYYTSYIILIISMLMFSLSLIRIKLNL